MLKINDSSGVGDEGIRNSQQDTSNEHLAFEIETMCQNKVKVKYKNTAFLILSLRGGFADCLDGLVNTELRDDNLTSETLS